jgi:hypothetical protein
MFSVKKSFLRTGASTKYSYAPDGVKNDIIL